MRGVQCRAKGALLSRDTCGGGDETWKAGDGERCEACQTTKTLLVQQNGLDSVYFPTYEDKQDPDCDLQTEGDGDQGDDRGIKRQGWPLL